jgi:MGT family glycosyltransferase
VAVILAYMSPALGHLYPFCALLRELHARGHQIHVRTLAAGVGLCRGLGFAAQPVDPRIEAIQEQDPESGSTLRAAELTVQVLGRRAALEVADLRAALVDAQPDLLLIDANCWGAMSAAETGRLPKLVFSPFVPYLDAPGAAPFGPGYAPRSDLVGTVRDLGARLVTSYIFDRPFRRAVNPLRARLGLPRVGSVGDLTRRADGMLVATAEPFQYPGITWGDDVHLIGPAIFEPPQGEPPDWLTDITLPVVMVTTSSVAQADSVLVRTTVQALADQPLHVVATVPAGADALDLAAHPRVTVRRFAPHVPILDRAVCVVTHGGMGVTQKALSRGVPVCAVPFGRDQFEVARRVEVARCGTRLPARRLTTARLRSGVLSAIGMTSGAARVAAGFARAGGSGRGADVVEAHL